MIHICHITSAHRRYDERVFFKECISLANAGYDVTLLVADGKPDEIRNGVKIVSATDIPKSRFQRIIKSSNVMYKKALKVDAEIYHLHDPELLPLARKLLKENKKVIFDSHEDVCGQISGKKWIPIFLRPIVSYFYRYYSNFVLSQLDYLIGVTPHLVEKLKIINPNSELITNYPEINLNDNYLEKSVKKTNSFCYAGGITEQWNHETILSALEDSDATYHLIGRVDPEFMSKLQKYKSWNKVKYYGQVPHKKVGILIGSCSVALAVLDYSRNTCGKIGTLGNTKLFEYMLAKLPVICTDFILWKEIIDKWKCGICIPPGDVDALQKAMQYMIDNPDKAKKMGENGRRVVLEEFNWGIEEKKLISLYQKL